MHEYAMTQRIINAVREEAKRAKASKVLETEIAIGEFTLLNPEQIAFWYKVLTKDDNVLTGSTIKIEVSPGKVKCDICGYEGKIKIEDDILFHVVFPTLKCPSCGSKVKIVSGRECVIKRVKMITYEKKIQR